MTATGEAPAVTADDRLPSRRRPPSYRRRAWVAVLVALGAIGFLLAKGLGSATEYFLTADQAVHQRATLGAERFRIEGTVVPGTVTSAGRQVRFDIENAGVRVAVVNTGYPPQLFQPGIPVVLEGYFSGSTFESDLIMVKHSADYVAKYPARVRQFVGR
ncbi:MAG TPA: cytochrome c maturation protein CcmE [Acidimicrobiales bacterium]|nr:cytochrome c maturation protein CcmE [Acidimicrobiales bacterium]